MNIRNLVNWLWPEVMRMQLQEKKSPIFDHDFPAPETGVPSPCSVRGNILDRHLPTSVGLHWNCGEPWHSFLRSTQGSKWELDSMRSIGPSDSKETWDSHKNQRAKENQDTWNWSNTCNLLPELVDDLSGRCYVREKKGSVMRVDDTEEFMWPDHR